MNQKIKEHLIAYCESQGLEISNDTFKQLLLASKIIQETLLSSKWLSRTDFRVINFENLLIGFNVITNTQDFTYTVDLDSVYECEPVEIKTIIYKAKQQQTFI